MLFDILKDFKGSQDGRLTEQFVKGSERELSESLAAVAVKEGWAKPVKTKKSKADHEADKKAAELAELRTLLTTEMGVLEGRLETAEEADKPAIQADLDAKRAEFAALQ